jgi:translation elongation factor P/translation initiation factor 5A
MPLQDNFKRLVVPVPGLSKLEHFTLEIYKAKLLNIMDDTYDIMMNSSIYQAIKLLNLIEEETKKLTNDKDSEMVIYNK